MFKKGDRVRRKKEFIHNTMWERVAENKIHTIFDVRANGTEIQLAGMDQWWVGHRFELAEKQPEDTAPGSRFHVGDIVKNGNTSYFVSEVFGSHEYEVVTINRYDTKTMEVGSVVGKHNHIHFELVQAAGRPVKISSLPVQGMSLQQVLERYERLREANLIIEED